MANGTTRAAESAAARNVVVCALAISKVIERIEAKIERVPFSGCWLWLGTVDKRGYGFFPLDLRSQRAHRVSYETFVGPIPEGLEVCHRCDVRCCVNPSHLFVGTHHQNVLDMVSKGRCRAGTWNKVKTHCKHGHEFTPANTRIKPDGCRECLACRATIYERYAQRKREGK